MEKGIILNGTNSVAVAKENDLIYRLEPISVIKEISFHNLKAEKNTVFDLSQQLSEDYEVLYITSDFLEDDNTPLDASVDRNTIVAGSVSLQQYEAGKLVTEFNIGARGLYKSTKGMHIKHNRVWKMLANKDINTLTFVCVPVIFDLATKFVATEEAQENDS